MPEFNQQHFNDLVLDNNVIGFRDPPLTLKSGRLSHFYANWRGPLNDVYTTLLVAAYVIDLARDLRLNPDCFIGVPEGATKLSIVTQLLYAEGAQDFGPGRYPLPMGRGRSKEHGDPENKSFVGAPRGKTIVLEDVTTTGVSLLETIANVRESGAEVIAAIGLTNRMELTPIPDKDSKEAVEKFRKIFRRAAGKEYRGSMSVVRALIDAHVPYFSLSDATELLPEVVKRLNPDEAIVEAIKAEYAKFGIQAIDL